MGYTLYAAGLACFIEQDDNSFVIALPDGRKAKEPHNAYLIVAVTPLVKTSNWRGDFRDGMLLLPIEPGVLTLPQPTGASHIDVTQYRKHKISWDIIDRDFEVSDKKNPKGSVATAAVRHGMFRMYRFNKKAEALIVQMDIPFPDPKDTEATIELIPWQKDAKPSRVTFPPDTQIVLANVSDARLRGGSAENDLEHFLLYYVLNVGGKSPSGKRPQPDMNATPVLSRHPFFNPDRDLSVSCTPTNKP